MQAFLAHRNLEIGDPVIPNRFLVGFFVPFHRFAYEQMFLLGISGSTGSIYWF